MMKRNTASGLFTESSEIFQALDVFGDILAVVRYPLQVNQHRDEDRPGLWLAGFFTKSHEVPFPALFHLAVDFLFPTEDKPYLLLVPPKTLKHIIFLAPELSATFNLE